MILLWMMMGLVEEAIMGAGRLSNTNKIEFSSAPHVSHKLATVANMTPVTRHRHVSRLLRLLVQDLLQLLWRVLKVTKRGGGLLKNV